MMAFYIEEMSTARQAELDKFWAKIGFTATPDWQIFAANTLAHEIVGTIAVQMIEGDACVRGLIIDAAHKEKSHVLLLALVHAVVEAAQRPAHPATGVQRTSSIRRAPTASITSRSKPSALPDASGIAASAARKSSSIG